MAARARSHSRAGFAGGRRRAPSSWARFIPTDGAFITVAPSTKVLLGGILLSNPGIGETVRRIRGVVSVRSDQASAVENQLGAFALVIVSDLALTAGAASIPSPVIDASDDGWFVYVPFAQASQTSGGGVVSHQYEFDSKAMRRVEEGFGVAIMVANASPAHALTVSFGVSLLSSLS